MIDCYQVFDNNTIKPVKAQIHYLKPIEYDEYKDLKTPEIAALVLKVEFKRVWMSIVNVYTCKWCALVL